MPLTYVFKRLFRSWQLYIALFLGVVLASTFFAGINIGADSATRQAIDQALKSVPVDFQGSSYSSLSLNSIEKIVNQTSKTQGVTHAEATVQIYGQANLPSNITYSVWLTGLSKDSVVYDGWSGGPSSINENDAYILSGSPDASAFKQGDIIQTNISLHNGTNLVLSLRVAGFASLDETASAVAYGRYYYGSYRGFVPQSGLAPLPFKLYEDILLVDLETTLGKLIDSLYSTGSFSFTPNFLVFINRNSIINVWDIAGTLQRLDALSSRIENNLLIAGFNLNLYSPLVPVLTSFQGSLMTMQLAFLVVSLPVFFVAWYMGTTVSDVSFNVRRREIGLLLTKGFSKGQLLRMFITEAILIGLAAGVIGTLLGAVLNPLFVAAIGGQFMGLPQIGIDTFVLAVAFSLVITILAVFRPARRAANLSTVDALREYMMVEDTKPYRKRWPWIALILGSYKMAIFVSGINLIAEMPRIATSGSNFLIVLVLGFWAFFDVYVLTYIGPPLFFWGFTKILIRGSLKFQEIAARAAKFLGDLGTLATRNVQRNPTRAAAVAFLIALIVGYGVQITAVLASDQDYKIRSAYVNVGADVSLSPASSVNASATSSIVNAIRSNVTGVRSVTSEYSFTGSSTFGGLQIRAVNLSEWLNTAYYEDGWFTGNSVKPAFQQLSTNNNSIILDLNFAKANDLHLNDKIWVAFFGAGLPAGRYLTIVGFFGVALSQQSPVFGPVYVSGFWSYVSDGLFHEISQGSTSFASVKLLVKLNPGTNGAVVADRIRALLPNAGTVDSVSEELKNTQSDFVSMATLNFQRLGVAFAIVATSLGIGLVTLISLRERQREASIMAVRGLSYKQLATILLTENMAVVVFAVLLGVIAGLVVAYGSIVSLGSVPSLVTRRLIFPLDATLTIFSYLALVFASTILPVMLMTRRYMSRLERVVRQA